GGGYDFKNDKKLLIPEDLKKYMAPGGYLINHKSEESTLSGILVLPENPLLVVSRPIVTSDGKGPIHGTIIFATYLDTDEIERLGGIVQLDIDVMKINDVGLPDDYKMAKAELLSGKKMVVHPLGISSIAGYTVLDDIFGKPGLLLRAQTPRDIYKHGQQTLAYFIVILVLVGIVLGVVIFVPLEKELMISERAGMRLLRINEAFLAFGADPLKNINTLTRLTGELMGSYSAAYIRHEKGKLIPIAKWNTPKDYDAVDSAEGYISYDIIRKGGNNITVIRELQKTKYAQTDPGVLKYDLCTYLGAPVSSSSSSSSSSVCIGVLCAVYQKDFVPVEEEKRVMSIIAAAIGVEENRARAERELIEARREADAAARAKGNFLANMSHEIRTPMNAILGFSDLLAKTGLDDKQLNYISTIKSSGAMLLDIINDILDFSKLESGKIHRDLVDFDIKYLIHDVFKMVLTRIDEKKVETYIDIPKDIPRYLKGDPTRLRQIFVNLLNNAAKFTHRGNIGVIVRFESAAEGASGKAAGDEKVILRFSVKDSGIGIPKDKQELIFRPFEQADMTTTRRYGGTGLGLAICRNLVAVMGGKMWVESEADKGSEFIFTAEFKKSDPTFHLEIYPVSAKELIGKTAMLVDDNKTALEITGNYCRDLGMQVISVCGSAKAAIEEAKRLIQNKNIPNFIISDIMMPDMDGYSLVEELRKIEALEKVKIIALTSDISVGAAHRAEKAGFNGFITKPVTFEELTKVMVIMLGDKRKERTIVTRHMAAELSCDGKKVLVVEDSVANQELIKAYFEVLKCEGDYAADGAEAVEKVKTRKYDMCFMDLQMPGMDGYEATRRIRQGGKKDLPIVALTADVRDTVYDDCIKAGMDDLLTKPVELNNLREKILKYCK
ncbi:MAG: response regulator, partial [Candidatus Omnitrophica bacterium]|nr:response regulator [Candidatus Omnitrophota bacterium]